jgi:hypothetical protein
MGPEAGPAGSMAASGVFLRSTGKNGQNRNGSLNAIAAYGQQIHAAREGDGVGGGFP